MGAYDTSLRAFTALLSQPGPGPVLAFLNGMTAHRYTALFQFDGATLRNVSVFDREQGQVTLDPVPIAASYCVFVRDSQSTFVVEDSLRDTRVLGHAKQGQVQSYCGVPLHDAQGEIIGTVCHFDSNPLQAEGHMVEFMEKAASLISKFAMTGAD